MKRRLTCQFNSVTQGDDSETRVKTIERDEIGPVTDVESKADNQGIVGDCTVSQCVKISQKRRRLEDLGQKKNAEKI